MRGFYEFVFGCGVGMIDVIDGLLCVVFVWDVVWMLWKKYAYARAGWFVLFVVMVDDVIVGVCEVLI